MWPTCAGSVWLVGFSHFVLFLDVHTNQRLCLLLWLVEVPGPLLLPSWFSSFPGLPAFWTSSHLAEAGLLIVAYEMVPRRTLCAHKFLEPYDWSPWLGLRACGQSFSLRLLLPPLTFVLVLENTVSQLCGLRTADVTHAACCWVLRCDPSILLVPVDLHLHFFGGICADCQGCIEMSVHAQLNFSLIWLLPLCKYSTLLSQSCGLSGTASLVPKVSGGWVVWEGCTCARCWLGPGLYLSMGGQEYENYTKILKQSY